MALPTARAPRITMVQGANGAITSHSGSGRGGTVGMKIQIEGLKAVQNGLRALGATDVPFVREGLEDIGEKLVPVLGAAMPYQSFKVGRPKVLGKAPALRLSVPVNHPAARTTEFGRRLYWYGFKKPGRIGKRGSPKGYSMRGGIKRDVSPRGQMARPYLGIVKGDSVVERIRPYAMARLVKAYTDEWNAASAAVGNDVIEVGS